MKQGIYEMDILKFVIQNENYSKFAKKNLQINGDYQMCNLQHNTDIYGHWQHCLFAMVRVSQGNFRGEAAI